MPLGTRLWPTAQTAAVYLLGSDYGLFLFACPKLKIQIVEKDRETSPTLL